MKSKVYLACLDLCLKALKSEAELSLCSHVYESLEMCYNEVMKDKDITEEKARQILLFLNHGDRFVITQHACNDSVLVLKSPDSGEHWSRCMPARCGFTQRLVTIPSSTSAGERCKTFFEACLECVKEYDIMKGMFSNVCVMRQGTTLEQVLIEMDMKVA